MTTWDELARAEAETELARRAETMWRTGGEHLGHSWAKGFERGFTEGAAWQRERLLSPPGGDRRRRLSTWDELATTEAERRDRKDGDWYALHADELFRQGAAWQREQLLADEAVERVAQEAVRSYYPFSSLGDALRLAGRDRLEEERRFARAVLTAAIGDQS